MSNHNKWLDDEVTQFKKKNRKDSFFEDEFGSKKEKRAKRNRRDSRKHRQTTNIDYEISFMDKYSQD